MAERRMFAKTIIDSDLFLDMPLSTQALYFHLSMRADDDGFVNNPKKIQRMIGANEDDLKLLILKNFVIAFETGIVVITHWKMHNTIRKDRHIETLYEDEKSLLELKNNEYILCQPSDNQMTTKCQPSVNQMTAQVRLGKDSIGKDSIGKDNIDLCSEPSDSKPSPSVPATPLPSSISLTLNTKEEYPVSQEDINQWMELYPSVDVMQELRKMKGWLDANPTRRKTKQGIKKFINTWLSREQDKGHKSTPSSSTGYSTSSSSSSDYYKEQVRKLINYQKPIDESEEGLPWN